jgi:hypothetical protein
VKRRAAPTAMTANGAIRAVIRRRRMAAPNGDVMARFDTMARFFRLVQRSRAEPRQWATNWAPRPN